MLPKPELELIADEVLEKAVEEKGWGCEEARILFYLRCLRVRDRQVYAFRLGTRWMTGPMPDAETEIAIKVFLDEDGDC